MNYLVHLFLSDPTPGCRLGNLMGDFVKGPVGDSWPAEIARGIRQHRRLDTFAHDHGAFRRSKRRLDTAYGHCRGVMVDIFYDHFLARNWARHSPQPLAAFAQGVYRLLETHDSLLPPGLRRVAPRMIAGDWLVSYRDLDTIGLVLERIAARLSRPTPMAGGLTELRRHYGGLEEDCEMFLADAAAFLRDLP